MNLLLFGLLALLVTECRGQDSGADADEPDQQMTIDELIASAMTVSSMDYLTDLNGQTVMQEMDMVFIKDQWMALQEKDEQSRKKRKAIRDTRYRWTGKVIPYRIAPGVFNSRARGEITKAINEWQTYTCLRFTQRSSQRNYVYFDNGSGCYSYVGMTGGPQTLGLAGGCRHKGVIVHEIGHAVGFHHEQNRPDRDNYVIIRRENIPGSLYYNFKKYPSSAVSTEVPYDYGSIMHYGGTAFSTNGRLTIQTRNRRDQNKIGNRRGLSFRDIKMANLMYSCDDKCGNARKTCPGEGFVGKDCECWCPGNPVQRCTGTTGGKTRPTTRRPVVSTRAPTCRNRNSRCQTWAQQGYCKRSNYMQMYCKPACNLCSTKPKPLCMDDKEHCAYWKNQGYCRGEYAAYMKDHCMLSCGHCSRSTSRVEGQGENGSSGIAKDLWLHLSSLLVLAVAFVLSGL